MRGVITKMWWFIHKRWKGREVTSRRDQHKVRREHLLSEVRVLSEEEKQMLLRYRFLFEPGLWKLKKSTLPRIQYWVEKSGGIIKRWRTKERERARQQEGDETYDHTWGRFR